MFNLLQTGLLLHIIGISTLVGATISDYVLRRQFRKDYKDRQRSIALMNGTRRLTKIAGIGLGLQIVSGMMMLAATDGAFGQQLWFKIKMVIVLVIIVCTVVLNRSLQNRLRKLVMDEVINESKDSQIMQVARRIKYVQLFLLGFFAMIFILSVFRFN